MRSHHELERDEYVRRLDAADRRLVEQQGTIARLREELSKHFALQTSVEKALRCKSLDSARRNLTKGLKVLGVY
jgi:hypothetical protein